MLNDKFFIAGGLLVCTIIAARKLEIVSKPQDQCKHREDMKLNIFLVLPIFLFQTSMSVGQYEYDYIDGEELQPTEVDKLFYDNADLQEYDESHEPSEYNYDDTMPLGDLSDSDKITLEQFVNELRRRKEIKEQQKHKNVDKPDSTKKKSTENVSTKKNDIKEINKVLQKTKTSSSSKPITSKRKEQKST